MKKNIFILMGLLILIPILLTTNSFSQTQYVCKQIQSCQGSGYSTVLTVTYLASGNVLVKKSIVPSSPSDLRGTYDLTTNGRSNNGIQVIINYAPNTWFIPFEDTYSAYLGYDGPTHIGCACSNSGSNVCCPGEPVPDFFTCLAWDCTGCCLTSVWYNNNSYGPGILINASNVILQ